MNSVTTTELSPRHLEIRELYSKIQKTYEIPVSLTHIADQTGIPNHQLSAWVNRGVEPRPENFEYARQRLQELLYARQQLQELLDKRQVTHAATAELKFAKGFFAKSYTENPWTGMRPLYRRRTLYLAITLSSIAGVLSTLLFQHFLY